MSAKIGILGAGSWGTAVAVLLQQNGHRVTLWEFREDVARQLAEVRENVAFLPGVPIPEDIIITPDLRLTVTGQELIVVMLPSHVVRSVSLQMAEFSLDRAIVVSGSKGIENDTLLRMSELLVEVVPELTPDRVVVLSGPSHAEEVGKGIPTVVVAASAQTEAAKRVQDIFMSPAFRVYTNDDIVGVELGGALKNVIAIAAGISDGVGFGDNTKAALLDRGIVEITRLGASMGANPLTFAGLSGMGDLIVTCTSRHSRNRFVGEQIGKGRKLAEILDEMVMVAEGIRTTRSTEDLAQRQKIEMPISEEVFRVLFEDKDPKAAVYDLMTRDPKAEDWG